MKKSTSKFIQRVAIESAVEFMMKMMGFSTYDICKMFVEENQKYEEENTELKLEVIELKRKLKEAKKRHLKK